jgi:thiamine biosynthesis protein ThiI
MNKEIILIRYGELSLKSAYVRKQFESTLLTNIKNALHKENIAHTLTKERGRLYLATDEAAKSLPMLNRIFGIVSVSPAIQTITTFENISKLAVNLMNTMLTPKKSFALRVTRVGTHPFTSQDVAIRIGNDIVKATHAPVNLTHPDVELFIEIRQNKTFLFTEKYNGVGGLPMGTQGKVLVRITHAPSLLAAWYLLHRGCTLLIAITGQTPIETIQSFLAQWYTSSEIIPIDSTKRNYITKLSALAMSHDCEAIVTGHTLENSCYTLQEIEMLKKSSNLPILTPLIAFEEREIKNLCRQRGIPL